MTSSWKLSLFWYLPTYFGLDFEENHKNYIKFPKTLKKFGKIIEKIMKKFSKFFPPEK